MPLTTIAGLDPAGKKISSKEFGNEKSRQLALQFQQQQTDAIDAATKEAGRELTRSEQINLFGDFTGKKGDDNILRELQKRQDAIFKDGVNPFGGKGDKFKLQRINAPFNLKKAEDKAVKAFASAASFKVDFEAQEGLRAKTAQNVLGARSTILAGGGDAVRANLLGNAGGRAATAGRGQRQLLAGKQKRVDENNLLGRSVTL